MPCHTVRIMVQACYTLAIQVTHRDWTCISSESALLTAQLELWGQEVTAPLESKQQVGQCIQSKLCLKFKYHWNPDLITVELLKILKTQWPTLRVFQPSSSRLLPLVCQLQPLVCQLQMFAVLVWNAQVTMLLSTQNSCIFFQILRPKLALHKKPISNFAMLII